MNDILKKIFGSSPRTTIMGYLSAIIAVAIPFIQDGNFDFHKDWKNLLIAVGLAVWGRVQKDSNGITSQEGKIVHEVVKEKVIEGSTNI